MQAKVREETRRERYNHKLTQAITMPISLVAINFDFDDNLAFLIRTAGCFGAKHVYVIGSIPDRSKLNPKSGSLFDYVSLKSFSNPSEFLAYTRENKIQLVSAELSEDAVSLYDYSFNREVETAIVLGHETVGVPVEILINSDKVYIPMMGAGYSLNTSQTGTAFITEYTRQYIQG